MKKIILILFVITTLTSKTKAQGNLQFNRVLLDSVSLTVPTGKVWKIESVLATTGLDLYWNLLYKFNSILINNSAIIINSAVGDSGNSTYGSINNDYSNISITHLPIWLPAGATVNIGVNTKYISIIEYNIIP